MSINITELRRRTAMRIELTRPGANDFWAFVGRFGGQWEIEVVGTHHNPRGQMWMNSDEEHRIGITPGLRQRREICAALADGRLSIADLERLANAEYERVQSRELVIPARPA